MLDYQNFTSREWALVAGIVGILYIYRDKIFTAVSNAANGVVDKVKIKPRVKSENKPLVVIRDYDNWIMVKKIFDQAVRNENESMMNAARDMAMSMMATPKVITFDGENDGRNDGENGND